MGKYLSKLEGIIIQLGVLVFWFLFWLLNVIDKFIGDRTFLWAGKDRLNQFIEYFSSVGIENPITAQGFLIFITIAEILALILIAISLWYFLKRNPQKTHDFFFWGTFIGLAIFSFFSIGDQIFGDRHELLEHTTYWMALIISWGAYTYFQK